MCLPVLLLDVDGVISLFGFDLQRPPAGRYVLVEGQLHFLSADAAGLVAELEPFYELVWCTGWEERADAHLPATLGLPAGLAHIRLHSDEQLAPAAARHYKLDAIDAFAGPSRPLAWVDDGHDDSCTSWAQRRDGPTLLVATDPATGLTAAHVGELRAWAGGRLPGGDL
jgi:hypothetical protein